MPEDKGGLKAPLLALSIASSVFLLDRLTKVIISNYVSFGHSIGVIPNIFHITLIFNKAAAFGLFGHNRIIFAAVAIVAIAVIVIYIFKARKGVKSSILASALGLILGGAAGNLFDRIRFGYVIDFLDLRVWPVFNIADSCITIGALILVILCIR